MCSGLWTDGHTSRGSPGSSSHHQHTTNRHQNNVCAVRCRTVWQKWFQPHGVGQDMDTTYIRPRLLHNAELWCLNNTNTNILEKFQRDRLKQLQGLPPRTSNCVTLAMMGMFPIEDKNSLEFDICEKQLTVKGSKSRSWLICITTLLTKYNLSAPEHMLYSTPNERYLENTPA